MAPHSAPRRVMRMYPHASSWAGSSPSMARIKFPSGRAEPDNMPAKSNPPISKEDDNCHAHTPKIKAFMIRNPGISRPRAAFIRPPRMKQFMKAPKRARPNAVARRLFSVGFPRFIVRYNLLFSESGQTGLLFRRNPYRANPSGRRAPVSAPSDRDGDPGQGQTGP